MHCKGEFAGPASRRLLLLEHLLLLHELLLLGCLVRIHLLRNLLHRLLHLLHGLLHLLRRLLHLLHRLLHLLHGLLHLCRLHGLGLRSGRCGLCRLWLLGVFRNNRLPGHLQVNLTS